MPAIQENNQGSRVPIRRIQSNWSQVLRVDREKILMDFNTSYSD